VQDTEEVTLAPSTQVDVSSALRRTERMVKAQKTKNASNKIKECTSIANVKQNQGAHFRCKRDCQAPQEDGEQFILC
jgi:hypothetical protein